MVKQANGGIEVEYRRNGVMSARGGVDGGGDEMTEPSTEEAKDERQDAIGAGFEPLAIFGQGQGLEAEGGESGVTAADTEHEELAKSGRSQPTAFGTCDGCKNADDEATGDVDDDGAPGKRLASSGGNTAGNPPARQATEATAHKYP